MHLMHWALQLLVRQEHRIYPVCAFTNGKIGLDRIGRAFRAADAVAQQVVSDFLLATLVVRMVRPTSSQLVVSI